MKPKTKDRTVRTLDVPRLVMQLPDGKEIHHHVVGSELTIGRDATNRISIPDQFVSKFHAKLLVSQTSMTLVDLESANKTYVNGRQITESPGALRGPAALRGCDLSSRGSSDPREETS